MPENYSCILPFLSCCVRIFRQGCARNGVGGAFASVKPEASVMAVPVVAESWQKEQQGKGRWNSSPHKGTQGLLGAGDGNKVWNQAQPCRDALTIVKVVDKPSHSYSAFLHCSEFPLFIYPVWCSFKIGFLVFQSLLVVSDKYSIRKDPGRCSLKQCFLSDPLAFLFSQMLCWICSKSHHF